MSRIRYENEAEPPTPPDGKTHVWVGLDKKLRFKDDAGLVTKAGGGWNRVLKSGEKITADAEVDIVIEPPSGTEFLVILEAGGTKELKLQHNGVDGLIDTSVGALQLQAAGLNWLKGQRSAVQYNCNGNISLAGDQAATLGHAAIRYGTFYAGDIRGRTAGGDTVGFMDSTGTRIVAVDDTGYALFGAATVAQPTHIADADGTLADITTKFNVLLAQAAALGHQAAV